MGKKICYYVTIERTSAFGANKIYNIQMEQVGTWKKNKFNLNVASKNPFTHSVNIP